MTKIQQYILPFHHAATDGRQLRVYSGRHGGRHVGGGLIPDANVRHGGRHVAGQLRVCSGRHGGRHVAGQLRVCSGRHVGRHVGGGLIPDVNVRHGGRHVGGQLRVCTGRHGGRHVGGQLRVCSGHVCVSRGGGRGQQGNHQPEAHAGTLAIAQKGHCCRGWGHGHTAPACVRCVGCRVGVVPCRAYG